MTLLQLAGDQVWPNLLPILAYRPGRVVFLTGGDPHGGFAEKARSIQSALAGIDVRFELELATARGTYPTMRSCLRALENLHDIDLANLTGGTKPMILAAHQFATARSIPSFYLDTRRKKDPFEDLGTGPGPLDFPDLSSLASTLDVRVALVAQGFPVPARLATPAAPDLAFAREAAEVRGEPDHDREIATALTTLRQRFHDHQGRGKFLRKGRLKAALAEPISAGPDSAWHRYLAAAARHGLVETLDPGHQFLIAAGDPHTTGSDALRSRAESVFKLLEGVWFELAVLDRLQAKSTFSDIRWSVQADPDSTPRADARGETDLVAFNRATLNLHFISCKTTGPHGTALDHIQGLRRRATKEGGKFSRAELWIFRPRSDDHRDSLRDLCREQGVDFRIFSEEP